MFGIVRPCRHRLTAGLFGEWTAHLCGLCLALRDLHGQASRLVTNYDGLLVSVLTDAQRPAAQRRRIAGPCALRGMRRIEVVDAAAAGAQLAAAVSLVLASGKIAHLLDAAADLAADEAAGAFNPLTATGTDLAGAREYCDGALLGLRLAVIDLDLEHRELLEALLVEEVARSVRHVFARRPAGPGHRRGLLRAQLAGCPVSGLGGLITGEPVPGPLPGPRPRRGCCSGCCGDGCCDCCGECCCEGCCEACGECNC